MYSLTFGSFLWRAPVQDETAHHCFLYFIKLFYIFRALDCDHFFESVRVKIWSGRTLCHTPHAWAEQKQCVCRMDTSARARRCAQQTEHNGGFGFQTKVKDRFLNQRRWTCWYSCRENMQVLSGTDSLVWLFVFILKSLLSLLFTSLYTMEAFLFLYYYYLIPQCLLNINKKLVGIIQHVMCPMPHLIRFC